MKLRNIVSSIKISFRVYALAALAVLATAILSASYFYGDMIMYREIRTQAVYDKLADQNQHVTVGTLQMRRSEKDFLLQRDIKYIKKYEVAFESVNHALVEMAGIKEAGAVVENIDKLKTGIIAHKAQFQTVYGLHQTLGLNEKEGLQGALHKAVHSVEEKLKKANLDSLTIKMLMMRRHEKDFMLRGAEKYVGRIDKRRAEFDALLKNAPISGAEKTELGTLMDAYQRDFKAYAATAMKLAPETKKLSAIFAEMAPEFDAVLDTAIAGKRRAMDNLNAAQIQTEHIFQGTVVFVLLLAAVFGLLVGKSITGPFRSLTESIRKLADGDTSVEISNSGDKNEIGDMARALLVFKRNVSRAAELEAEQDAEKRRAEEEKKRALMHQLADDFDSNVGAIVETVSSASAELNSTAQSLAGIAEETSSQANSVAAASELASANVQTVASATEEMASSVAEIIGQVDNASQISKKAVEDVSRTATQIGSLAETADKIGDVVSMISDIAKQTNLLALNATIESARAGEAGRGFAVVASEVKALANETAKATAGISELIAEVQTQTRTAVDAIAEIGTVINQLDETSSVVATAMEEQGAATQEVARNVTEAASGTKEVSSGITSVTQASQETGAASGQVMSATQELSRQAELMKSEVEKFLLQVRAA